MPLFGLAFIRPLSVRRFLAPLPDTVREFVALLPCDNTLLGSLLYKGCSLILIVENEPKLPSDLIEKNIWRELYNT